MILNQKLNGKQIIGCNLPLLTSMSGFGNPKIRTSNYDRGSAHGKVANRSLYSGYAVDMVYKLIAYTPEKFHSMRDWFLGLWTLPAHDDVKTWLLETQIANGEWRKLEIYPSAVVSDYKADSPLSCDVQITAYSTRPYFTAIDKRKVLVPGREHSNLGFKLPIKIPFSLADGVPSFSSKNSLNAGNFPAYPIIQVGGQVEAGWSVAITSGSQSYQLRCALGLETGATITLDTWNRTASLNNAQNILSAISGDWWTIPPGDTKITFLAEGGNAEAIWEDTYINL